MIMMTVKSILTTIFVLTSAASAFEMTLMSSGRQGLEIDIRFQRPETTSVVIGERTYHRIVMEGCRASADPGQPELPQKSFMVAVPPNHRLVAEVSTSGGGELKGIRPLPAPGLNDGTERAFILGDGYRVDGTYPKTKLMVSEPAWIGRIKVATVTVFPVVFRPGPEALQWSDRFNISIKYLPAYTQDRPADPWPPPLPTPSEKTALDVLINSVQAAEWFCRPTGQNQKVSTVSSDTLPFKMLVRSDGIHRVGYADLAAAGIDPRLFDPRNLKVFYRGREVPIYFPGQEDGIFDLQDYFEFFGQRAKGENTHFHAYTDNQVYYLGFGGANGARMVEEDALPSSHHSYVPSEFNDTLHFEHDSIFVRLNKRESDQSDRWFWRRVDQGDSLVAVFDLSGLNASSQSPVEFTVALHGYTYVDNGTDPDHGVAATINGHVLPAQFFDGQAPYLYRVSIPSHWCQPTSNRLIFYHAQVPYTNDSYLLNWIEVSYFRLYKPEGDRLEFIRPSGTPDTLCEFTVGGFSSHVIDIYKPGTSKLTGIKIEAGPSGLDYQATFQDKSFGPVGYVAVDGGAAARLKPAAIIPNRSSDLRNLTNRGLYLIVAPDTLRSQALALAAQRSAQFPSATVALTSDIYDEFNGGLPSDAAVKDFIRYAYEHWVEPPAYVLLMGEGSYDPRNLLGNSRIDFVPVHFTRTDDFGPVADDNWYACVSGSDQLPDIALGRLAVSTVPQYAQWENKRYFYENSPIVDQWRRDFMLVAGWPKEPGDDFHTPSDQLASSLDPRFTVSKVYHGPGQHSTQNLIEQFNEGSAVLFYYGHGGGRVWSMSFFFTNNEIPRLNNWGRWPFVTAATCFSGAFDVPDTTSLSQDLLRAHGGAIGVLASSGPSWGNTMEWTVAGAINEKGNRRLGDIALSAKYQLSGGLPPGGYISEMMSSFNLLGDPATSLALADTGLRPALSPSSVAPGDSLGLLLTGDFPASSIGLFSLADFTDTVRLQRAFTVTQAGFAKVVLAGDSTLDSGSYRARVYLKHGHRDWASSTDLGVGCPAFSGFRVNPARPTDLDSISISALAYSQSGIDSVWCSYGFGSRNDTLSATNRVAMVPLGGDTFSLSSRLVMAGYQPYLIYRLSLADTQGLIWSSDYQTVRIWRRPDLVPDPLATPVSMGGYKRLSLQAWIRNRGEMDAVAVPVHFYAEGSDSLIGVVMVDTVKINQVKKAELSWPHGNRRTDVYIRIDPLGVMSPSDQDTSNNRSAPCRVPKEPYYYWQLNQTGGSGDTVVLDGGRFRWFLPDSCLPDSAVAFYGELEIDGSSPYYPSLQPGLVPFDTILPYYGLMVGLCDSSLGLLPSKRIYVAIADSGLDSANVKNAGVYCLGKMSGQHKLIGEDRLFGWCWGRSQSTGLFSLLCRADTTGPTIVARVDRRATGWGNYVRTSAQLYHIIAEDPDGVDPFSFRIRQDGVEMPISNYSIDFNPADSRSLPVLYPATLGQGHHTLEFEAADLLGNRSISRDEVDVLVAFGLYEIANYPNPVDGDLTTFYFFVGDHADRWRTDIYTVAGRHLRTLEGGYASGVHTFDWDLTDREGRRVANGVYFYVMTVWAGERAEKRTGKLAILR
jgi:hypothetical protein